MKQWTWDSRRRVYVDAQGHTLTKGELNADIDEYIENTQEDIAKDVAMYTAGAITLAVLFSQLKDTVESLHGATGAIAYGGLEQMDAEKWARINERVSTELSYLNQFRQDVQAAQASGEALSAEGITARASLYAEAGYSQFVSQTSQRESDNGVSMGRRVCAEDDASCDECVGAATEEFIPLDEIPDIGSLTCMHNCRCEIEYEEPLDLVPPDLLIDVNISQESVQ